MNTNCHELTTNFQKLFLSVDEGDLYEQEFVILYLYSLIAELAVQAVFLTVVVDFLEVLGGIKPGLEALPPTMTTEVAEDDNALLADGGGTGETTQKEIHAPYEDDARCYDDIQLACGTRTEEVAGCITDVIGHDANEDLA